jgi:hypothetical protein
VIFSFSYRSNPSAPKSTNRLITWCCDLQFFLLLTWHMFLKSWTSIRYFSNSNSSSVKSSSRFSWKQGTFWYYIYIFMGQNQGGLYWLSCSQIHSSGELCLVRAPLHLEAGPIPLEADCMKFQPLLGWRSASTTYYNKVTTGGNFSTCKGHRAKKPCRFNKSSIIQRI